MMANYTLIFSSFVICTGSNKSLYSRLFSEFVVIDLQQKFKKINTLISDRFTSCLAYIYIRK